MRTLYVLGEFGRCWCDFRPRYERLRPILGRFRPTGAAPAHISHVGQPSFRDEGTANFRNAGHCFQNWANADGHRPTLVNSRASLVGIGLKAGEEVGPTLANLAEVGVGGSWHDIGRKLGGVRPVAVSKCAYACPVDNCARIGRSRFGATGFVATALRSARHSDKGFASARAHRSSAPRHPHSAFPPVFHTPLCAGSLSRPTSSAPLVARIHAPWPPYRRAQLEAAVDDISRRRGHRRDDSRKLAVPFGRRSFVECHFGFG